MKIHSVKILYPRDDARAMGREPSKNRGGGRRRPSRVEPARLEQFSTYSVIFKPMCAARTRARGPARASRGRRARAGARARVPASKRNSPFLCAIRIYRRFMTHQSCRDALQGRCIHFSRVPASRVDAGLETGVTRGSRIAGRRRVARRRDAGRRDARSSVGRPSRRRANEGARVRTKAAVARARRGRGRAREARFMLRARARAPRVVDRARDDRGGGRAGVARGDADDIRAVRVEETGRVVEQRARLESKVFGVEARRRRSRAAGTRLGAAARDEVASGDELWDRERSYVVRAGAREGLFQHG